MTNSYTPHKVAGINEPIKKISCGGHHTAFLADSGNLYMVGDGRDGELARGEVLESNSVKRKLPLLVNYVFISHLINNLIIFDYII